MNDKAIMMKKEIRLLSQYRSLMISRHFLTLILSVIAIGFSFFHYNMAPLYTVILLNAFPPVLTYAIRDNIKNARNPLLIAVAKDETFLLEHLRKRYRYSRLSYLSNSITFLIAILFMALWQYNFSTKAPVPHYLERLPVIILSAGLLLRIIGIPFYRIKLHYDLTHNKLK